MTLFHHTTGLADNAVKDSDSRIRKNSDVLGQTLKSCDFSYKRGPTFSHMEIPNGVG